MNILMLNYEYPPLGGGAGNATYYTLRELARDATLEIDLVTSSDGVARIEEPYSRVKIHFVDIGKRGSLHYQTNRDLLEYARQARKCAHRLMSQRQYQVCHAYFGIPCGFVARRLRIPYIVSLRGSDVPFYNPRFRTLDKLVFKRLSRRIWRDAARVVANSEGLRALALETAPDQPIDVIPNGVDCARFRPSPRPGDRLRVLCVSRLIQRKRIDIAIDALDRLRDLPIDLTIAGDGNRAETLHDQVAARGLADRVQFLGRVPHEELPAIYQAHDVFVLPSENEGMSNTILEAMACGLPILATQTGGTSELIGNSENGVWIEKGSVQSLADALSLYARDRSLVERHGRASRRRAESMSWSAVASAYRRLYDAVAGAD